MKKILALLLAAVATASAAPQLPIDQAVKIAMGYLKDNSREGTFITSINLEMPSMNKGPTVWAVKWNAPVALSDTKRETGLEISMDGKAKVAEGDYCRGGKNPDGCGRHDGQGLGS